MSPTFNHEDTTSLERQARRNVKSRLGWLTHAGIYLAVMGGMTAVAFWQGRHPPLGAALGWGLGLAIHGARVFLLGAGAGWRERLVEAERQRLSAARRG